ncbi:MAG: acyl-CoA dehydrogenase [Lautropia sp.]|nr:MAG: acyl-CoA dehydrogenase [Pseudomonadota bacterium]MBC6959687.1 acyl-CoA dehydrogenase [Lautropia sp.]MCL4701575.1 acyl-CoA/acyl-ACP dehydrogenase [Burkholderiaceae bacterium]MDL1906205.1 acyl-CoA dehydrogenase [Betaproteobacteria bacterium PRO1]RIK91522.1 MAG: hypothetical protein DCC70_00755 [Burkholderiales bacterium]
MNFEPSDAQRIAGDAVRRFLEHEFPRTRLRDVERDGLGAFLPVYRRMGDLGYLGVAMPEEYGGSGGTLLDLALVAEEMGRALVPTLQVSSIVLAARALLAFGAGERLGARMRALVAGRRVAATAIGDPVGHENGAGQAYLVEACDVADEILVVAREGGDRAAWRLVPLSELGPLPHARRLTSLERVWRIEAARLACADAPLIVGAWHDWQTVVDDANTIAAAWALGAARAAIEIGVAYAKERRQFGRPIGSFQAVQHRLADSAVALEQASALVRYSAWACASGHRSGRMASMAKLVAGRALRQATYAAMMTHGGYGFTEEFDIQLYFRRARQLEQLIEGPARLRERIAEDDADDGILVH